MGTTRSLVAASLRYRNRAEITVLMCEQKPPPPLPPGQKPYQVWFSRRHKRCPVYNLVPRALFPGPGDEVVRYSVIFMQKFATVYRLTRSVSDASSDISHCFFFSFNKIAQRPPWEYIKVAVVERSIDRLLPKMRLLLREVARQTAFILA